MWLFLKNVIFTVLVPGTVAGYIPYRIVLAAGQGFAFVWSPAAVAALFVMTLGAAIYFWCLWDFAKTGRGTPSPLDAPTRLVVRGLYRYVRNPMYVGVITVILGWAWLYNSAAVLEYAGWIFLLFNGVIFIIEEPSLRRQFGAEYEAYSKKVGRWIPGRPLPRRPNRTRRCDGYSACSGIGSWSGNI